MSKKAKKNRDSNKNTAKILKSNKVALFILTYNAEKHIQKTLERIPRSIIPLFAEIFLIDDSSSDKTIEQVRSYLKKRGLQNFSVMKTPFNQGYGGNQKIGYTYAIEKGFDFVIMLHGDGQYPPELLTKIISQLPNAPEGAVFGSRMINRTHALKGGMPLYKWLGNQILTSIENRLLGSNLSEFHSGYRAYSISALKNIPFQKNSDNFHFDTDIIIQLIAKKLPILEVPMPTHYGDETCHVNGIEYAWNCLKSAAKFRLHSMGIFYQPNFDLPEPSARVYDYKCHPNTLHAFIRDHIEWKSDQTVADIGANDGQLSAAIAKKVTKIVAVDREAPRSNPNVEPIALDLNSDFPEALGQSRFDTVLALDVIEHLYEPEEATENLQKILKNGGTLYASTANIGYIILRLALFLGWFNYGKRGILDKTHHRLFTVSSFQRLLENSGFEVENIIGFGPPIADQISSKGIFGVLDTFLDWLAKIYPPLFSFNYLIIAKKKIPFEQSYRHTLLAKEHPAE